jgi:NAD(P)H dehydrogenase (quinone)
MHVLIVHAHPEPASFNAALKGAAMAEITGSGHTVEVSDLYAEGFQPEAGRHDFDSVADAARFHYQSEQLLAATQGSFSAEVRREQARVRRADLLILQFPLWWGAPPAILKGWFDRVLAYGFAYVDGRRFDSGLMQGRRSLICVTTGGGADRFAPDSNYGEIDRVLWPVQQLTLRYMGYTAPAPFVCYAAPRVPPEQRALYLSQWKARIAAELARPVSSQPLPDATSLVVMNTSRSWSTAADAPRNQQNRETPHV